MAYRHYSLSCLLILLATAGCSNDVTRKEELSGFISDYSNLQPLELPSGTLILHWRNSAFTQKHYKKIILEPTVFYPAPRVNDNVSADILKKITAHVDERLHELAKKNNIPVTQTPGKEVLRIRTAFSSIKITGESFTIRNLFPVQLVLTAAELAVGGRDQDVTMIHEFEAVDSLTGESMIKGIRKGNALQLANDRTKLTMEHIQPLMDKWGMDITEGFSRFAKLLDDS